MEPAKNKSFRKTFKTQPKGNFVNETELGPELTEDECTPQLWETLNFVETEGDDQDGNQGL
ncbi:hypothetical protein [Mucilaginibacter phyllosphaerae]